MKKQIILMVVLLFIPFGLADLGTFEQGTCVNLRTILNTTAVNLSSVSFPEPNNSVLYVDDAMTKNGLTFSYSFCDTTQLGDYIYDYYDAEGNVYVNNFEIAYFGLELTTPLTLLYIGLIAIMILFAALLSWMLKLLPGGDMKDDENRIIQINWLKHLRMPLIGVIYLCITGVLYIGGILGIAYLGGSIGNILWSLSMILLWLTLPMIVLLFFKIIDNVMADFRRQKNLSLGVDLYE